MHRMGELQSVHAARHLDVGKQQGNVRTGFQDGKRLVGVHGFDPGKPGILHDVDRFHPEHHLIFDDQDVRRSFCGL